MEEIFSRFGIWTPGTLQLGDIVDADTFERVGNISDKPFNIKFESEDIGDYNPSLTREWSTAGTKVIAGGANSAVAQTEISMQFGSRNGIYFATKGSRIIGIKDLDSLGKTIIKLYEKGKWEKNYYVVTELECADKVIVIVTNDKNAEVKFHVDADLPIQTNLVEANFKIGACSCVSHKITSDKPNTSVLFAGKKIHKKGLGFGATSFRGELDGRQTDEETPYEFGDLEPEDFNKYEENNPD